jgi:uncharacterized membrane protein YhaH (DUF805 family)
MNWFVTVLMRYAQFRGRASRSEYWYFFLIYFVISILLGLLDAVLGIGVGTNMGLLSGILGLALLVPSLAVGVRRLHDIDKSGWWLLVAFVPLVGWIILLVFACRASDPGPNRFGDGPGEML